MRGLLRGGSTSQVGVIYLMFFSLMLLATLGCNKTGQNSEEHIQNDVPTITYAMLSTGVVDAISMIAIDQSTWPDSMFTVEDLRFTTGRGTAESIVGGQSNLATMAEWPFLLSSRQNPSLRTVAVITSANSIDIIGRKSKGVLEVTDLKGKSIGVSLGTTGQYVLESFLDTQGISKRDYEVVNLSPPDLIAAIQRGDLDAICTWQPNIQIARDLLENDAISLDAANFFRVKYLLVTTEEFLEAQPDAVSEVLNGLISAERFARENREEAMKIVASFTNAEVDLIEKIWPLFDFSVTIDDELISTLEKVESWAKLAEIIPPSEMNRDWGEFIETEFLLSIDSEKVTLNTVPAVQQ